MKKSSGWGAIALHPEEVEAEFREGEQIELSDRRKRELRAEAEALCTRAPLGNEAEALAEVWQPAKVEDCPDCKTTQGKWQPVFKDETQVVPVLKIAKITVQGMVIFTKHVDYATSMFRNVEVLEMTEEESYEQTAANLISVAETTETLDLIKFAQPVESVQVYQNPQGTMIDSGQLAPRFPCKIVYEGNNQKGDQ
jgi:hypothetical protein